MSDAPAKYEVLTLAFNSVLNLVDVKHLAHLVVCRECKRISDCRF